MHILRNYFGRSSGFKMHMPHLASTADCQLFSATHKKSNCLSCRDIHARYKRGFALLMKHMHQLRVFAPGDGNGH